MRLSWYRFLSRLNKLLLPKIHTKPDLTRLNGFQKAIVGWKMYVTYRHLDELKKRQDTPLDGDPLAH